VINNRNLEEENWTFIEVTKINDKIIKDLIQNLDKELSDDFYISLESLIRIGKPAEEELKASLNELEHGYNFKKSILNVLLNNIEEKDIERSLLLQLYHTDFTIRANAILQIEQEKKYKYLPYLLPLLEDPDDSVRWALINSLINLNLVENPLILKKLEARLNRETNRVIKQKLESLISGS